MWYELTDYGTVRRSSARQRRWVRRLGRRDMVIIEAIYASAARRKRVEIAL